MLKSLMAIGALLVATALLYAGNGLQGTLLSVRGDLEAFSTGVLGILVSAYYIGFIAGCRIVPSIIGAVGHIRTFVALASVASSSALAHALIVDPVAWSVLRVVSGFGFAGLAMVLESWINERATNQNRGTLLSIYRIVDLGAITVGNALLGVADPEAFHLFALVSILISLGLVPLALTRSEAPAVPQSVRLDLGRLYAVSPVGAAGGLVTGLANAAFWGLGPVFAQRLGYEPATVGAFMGISIFGGALFQFPVGWISDRVDRRKVVLIAVLLGVVSAIGLAVLASQSVLFLFGLGFVFGALILPTFGLCAAHANDVTDRGDEVATNGGLLLLHGIGAVVGAVAGAAVMSLGPPEALFGYIATVYFVFAVFVVFRVFARAPVADADKTPFVPSPKSPSTDIGDEVDPAA
ncbi:MAG: MFS transporter [Pseudomonadota bacterium]